LPGNTAPLGPFARYLPVKSCLRQDLRFIDLLAEVTLRINEAETWQHCFDWQQVTADERNGEAGFFPACFEFVEQSSRYSCGPHSLSVSKLYACIDRFKIKLTCLVKGELLVTDFHYDSNSFRADDVTRLAGQFQTLLKSAVSDPEASIGELEILTDLERQQLLRDFNRTESRLPVPGFVHRLFEESAKRTPDGIAAVFENEQVSYAELNSRANRLARYLRAQGIGQDDRGGICVGRSIDSMVAILGILKAGGAYAPLDPSLPKARLAFILRDTEGRILLTQERLVNALPQHHAQVFCLDGDWSAAAEPADDNLPDLVEGGNLVYVMYTSGSTGEPKGVAVEHKQLLNYVHGILDVLKPPRGADFATVSTLAADLGNTVIFTSLATGGRLHLISQEMLSDPGLLADYFQRNYIDYLKIVPSHLAALMVTDKSEKLIPRRCLVLGGDAAHWDLVEKLRAAAPDCAVFNHYGPTETTVGVLTHRVDEADAERLSATLPLGRPISNTEIYVLDSRLTPVPVWSTGEVYIGGAGVARGYLNRPDSTAERFIPNPFGKTRGARFYRSGDLARYLPGGKLEFLRRVDDQVKTRGYRVELGEIRSALCEHPAIGQALAVAIDDGAGDKRLAAYLVLKRHPGPSANELRAFLGQTLPDHMIPSAFVTLNRLPLTPNGKIDRKALPQPSWTDFDSREYVPPQNELEAILAAIWEHVLDVPLVGVHDNYFSLGGDSIRVIQITQEAKKYNLRVSALDVFRSLTVHKLARHVAECREGVTSNGIPLELIKLPDSVLASLPDDIEDAYPVSKMQQFILSRYADGHEVTGVYHIQHLRHVYDESLSLSALKRAVDLLIDKHPGLRTVFHTDTNGTPLQAVKKRFDCPPMEVDDLRILDAARQEERIDAAMIDDRCNLFDTTNTNDPLFRFRVFLRSDNSAELLMSMHHAITDGWGNAELEKDLVELYSSIKKGIEPNIIPDSKSFKEFIALEQEVISSQEAASFWKNHLIDHKSQILIRRPASDQSPGTNEILSLDSDMANGLYRLGRDARVSLKAIFLSAYLDLIGAVTEQEIVTVGVVSNGRSERLSDPLKAIGLFWNIVPFCCRLSFDDKLAQLKKAQQLLIDVEAYVRYPLPQILEDQKRTELFFATLNFINFHEDRESSVSTTAGEIGFRVHDKFHFALNYVVAVSPTDRQMGLRVEYDQDYFNRETNRSMMGAYLETLKNLSRLS